MTQTKASYEDLKVGLEFPPASLRLTNDMVSAYIRAVGWDPNEQEESRTVPPMAVAALALAAMSANLSLAPGAIHISQELEFLCAVEPNESLTSFARVNRKIERGKFHMLTIGIKVLNQKKTTVLTGETSFILPGP